MVQRIYSESNLYNDVASNPLPEVVTKIQLPKFLNLTFCQLYSLILIIIHILKKFGSFSRYFTTKKNRMVIFLQSTYSTEISHRSKFMFCVILKFFKAVYFQICILHFFFVLFIYLFYFNSLLCHLDTLEVQGRH